MNFNQTLESLIILPIWHSILIQGIHGKGKTEAVRLAAKKLGAGYHDERLSQCDVGDLKGMPFFINGRTVFAMPEWYPLRKSDVEDLKRKLKDDISIGLEDKIGYLALEEIDRATRQVQQASFQICLDRELNGRKLRQGWRVVACVNGDDDIYQVLDMDPAFIDRWVWLTFRPETDEWLNHARGIEYLSDRDFSIDPEWLIELETKYRNKVHPAVVEFITRYPTMLDPTKQQIEENPGKKLQSRRSWTRLSEAIYVINEHRKAGHTDRNLLGKDPEKDIPYLLAVADGYVGELAASQFASFVQTDYQSLDANTILNKWTKDVGKRLKKIVDENGTLELSQYNRLIVQYVQDQGIEELNDQQSKNLIEYIKILPREVCADFWKHFATEVKDPALKWYRGKYKPEISKVMLRAMTNPNTVKK